MNWRNLQFIFNPNYWFMNYPYSKEVDVLMNALLDQYEFSYLDEYTASLGQFRIWIANRPYASMTFYGITSLERLRPSRLTIKRAFKKLDNIRSNEMHEMKNKDLENLQKLILKNQS